MVALESSRGLAGGSLASPCSSLGGVEGGEPEGSGVGRTGLRPPRGRRELKAETGSPPALRVSLGGALSPRFSRLTVSIPLCRPGYRFLGVPVLRRTKRGHLPTVPSPYVVELGWTSCVCTGADARRSWGWLLVSGPEPVLVALPAEAPTRTGRRRLPQGRGRRTTASTACTCPVCTAVAAATAVRPASRLRPTLSATPRSPSTCESCQEQGAARAGTGGARLRARLHGAQCGQRVCPRGHRVRILPGPPAGRRGAWHSGDCFQTGLPGGARAVGVSLALNAC